MINRLDSETPLRLPLEVIERIVSHALLDLSPHFLYTLSLLCRQFHSLAQRQLYTFSMLYSEAHITLFLRCLKKDSSGNNKRLVRGLDLVGRQKAEETELEWKVSNGVLKSLFRECEDLEVLRISWIKNFRLQLVNECRSKFLNSSPIPRLCSRWHCRSPLAFNLLLLPFSHPLSFLPSPSPSVIETKDGARTCPRETTKKEVEEVLVEE